MQFGPLPPWVTTKEYWRLLIHDQDHCVACDVLRSSYQGVGGGMLEYVRSRQTWTEESGEADPSEAARKDFSSGKESCECRRRPHGCPDREPVSQFHSRAVHWKYESRCQQYLRR